MEISNRLKQVIFRKLYKDLSKIEIVSYGDSIWFIDRENKYWYFEYKQGGTLYWRYGFFISFFDFFSIESDDFKSIISEWVEEVLNCKVSTTITSIFSNAYEVEEALNYKVLKTEPGEVYNVYEVEEVLNYKVLTTEHFRSPHLSMMEKVLKYKVSETRTGNSPPNILIEEVLSSK
jgi:hypothetical protein